MALHSVSSMLDSPGDLVMIKHQAVSLFLTRSGLALLGFGHSRF